MRGGSGKVGVGSGWPLCGGGAWGGGWWRQPELKAVAGWVAVGWGGERVKDWGGGRVVGVGDEAVLPSFGGVVRHERLVQAGGILRSCRRPSCPRRRGGGVHQSGFLDGCEILSEEAGL